MHVWGVLKDEEGDEIAYIPISKTTKRAVKGYVCPVSCGACCQSDWERIAQLEGEGLQGKECPHLKENGCDWPRDERPLECINYACSLSMLADLGRVTKEQIEKTIEAKQQNLAMKFLGMGPFLAIDLNRNPIFLQGEWWEATVAYFNRFPREPGTPGVRHLTAR